jgi:hypothetical protein
VLTVDTNIGYFHSLKTRNRAKRQCWRSSTSFDFRNHLHHQRSQVLLTRNGAWKSSLRDVCKPTHVMVYRSISRLGNTQGLSSSNLQHQYVYGIFMYRLALALLNANSTVQFDNSLAGKWKTLYFNEKSRFIRTVTEYRYCSLLQSIPSQHISCTTLGVSRATGIQSTPSHPISLRPILTAPHIRLGLPSGLFPSGFPQKTLRLFILPVHATCPAHLRLLDSITLITCCEE